MQIISKMLPDVKNIIGIQKYDRDKTYRKSIFLVEWEMERGKNMILNLFTRELFLMDDQEKSDFDSKNGKQIESYVSRWLYVPEDADEMSLVDFFREEYQKIKIPSEIEEITGYTILTTTECNARCPYCYEKRVKKIPMNEKTASDLADFIMNRRNGKKVKLHWFGGEPLFNQKAIDIICQKLKENGVLYSSFMVTNGYLIDEPGIEKIKNQWKIERVQITLDGTEEVYNQTKGYIYENSNGFKKVMENIHMLCNGGVRVTIRINMSDDNFGDLFKLIAYLNKEFQDFKGKMLGIYCHPLFDSLNEMHHCYEREGSGTVYEHLTQIYKYLADLGFSSGYDIQSIKYHRCMADGKSSIVITPGGNLTLCEHCTETHIIGNIWEGILDKEEIREWSTKLVFDECRLCFYYPQCYKLENCPVDPVCCDAERKYNLFLTQKAMERMYKKSHADRWHRVIRPKWIENGRLKDI